LTEIHLSTPPLYRFDATVNSHGWYQLAPFERNDENGLTLQYQFQTSKGQRVQVALSDAGDAIRAEVSAPAKTDLAEVESRLRWILSLDNDMSAFYKLCKKEPKLKHVPKDGGGRLLRSASVWEDVVRVITTTNTAWSGTKRMCSNLVQHWGPTFPSAETLADVTIESLTEKGGLGYRAAYIQQLAQAVASGDLDLEGLRQTEMATPELFKFLRQLKGIGDYAAATLLMLLGRYNTVPVDSIARDTVSKHFFDGEPVTPAQIRETFARFEDYAALAYYCWNY
jgi:3-methyladenine DNA glycosylase/8-oxoguanine DNA glycosylase